VEHAEAGLLAAGQALGQVAPSAVERRIPSSD